MMDYEDYRRGDGKLDIDLAYPHLTEAAGIITRHTFGRLEGRELPEQACYLLAALTDLLHDRSRRRDVAGETSDGVSVTYQIGQEDTAICRMVQSYLSGVKVDGVPVLYRGV